MRILEIPLHQWNKQNADQCMPTTSLYYCTCKLFPIFTSLHALLTVTVVLGNLPLRHWKTIETLQTLPLSQRDICCKQQNCGKSWSYLTTLTEERKKRRSPKEEVNFLNLNRVKFVKITVFYSLWLSYFLEFYFTLVYICKVEFKLLSISGLKAKVQLINL